MMQLILAVHYYEQSNRVLPPGSVHHDEPVRREPTGYQFGWLARLLPFSDHSNLYKHLDFRFGAFDPANSTVRSVSVSAFVCPSEMFPQKLDGIAPSNYAACHNDLESPITTTNHGVFFLNSRIRSDRIEDGASNTLFLGEKSIEDRHLGWVSGSAATLRNLGEPINRNGVQCSRSASATVGERHVDPLAVGGFSSAHPSGCTFGFGDGSVRFVSASTTVSVLQQMANRSDGSFTESVGF
jgi:prepilin-type processing-associated H-X9-DG protein